MPDSKPLLSLVLSFRNEAATIPELLSRLTRTLSALPIDYELVFVNDASDDESLPLLAGAAATDRHLKVVTMSRRFGRTECALAGFAFSTGEAVVLMDADLQDPPELIPELVDRWRAGADVVYTVRTARRGESAAKMFLTRLAYRIIRAVANIDLPVEAGDFRLMSRRVVNELLKLPEHTPYLRGLVTWVGFKQVAVSYERQPRFAGRTHFPMFLSRNPWRDFLSGVSSFSSAPLAVILALGLVICLGSIGAAALIGVVPQWRAAVPLSALIGLGITALGGLQLAALGIVGLYVGRMYQDVRGRPRYIVDHVIGGDPMTPR